MTRSEARKEILALANKLRLPDFNIRPYRMRHIQMAVFVLRQKQAVSAHLLQAAGFNLRGGTP